MGGEPACLLLRGRRKFFREFTAVRPQTNPAHSHC
jgi:hypothetical protein